MPDFNVRSDSVNVEQIMEQIRARIREKRGVDYTEQQIRELAAVKLEKFLDPRGVRSDLLEEFRRAQPPYQPPQLPNYAFEDNTLFDSHRGALRFIRRLLKPILKLFFNPNPLIQALHVQSQVNTTLAEREARLEASRRSTESLYYELIHNLVVETTRMGIEVKNLTMRIESLTGRLEFNERRARSLESAVVYKPAPGDIHVAAEPSHRPPPPPPPSAPAAPPAFQPSGAPPAPGGQPGGPEGPGQRSRRRRRRRGRRSGPPAASLMSGPDAAAAPHDSDASQESEIHSPAAESFEQALGSESHSVEHDDGPDAPADTDPDGRQ
jgi:hypothetical protein